MRSSALQSGRRKGGKLLCVQVTLCYHQDISFVFQLKEDVRRVEVLLDLSLSLGYDMQW